MKNEDVCSVVIPTRKLSEYLKVAIDELLSIYPTIEIIIVSDELFSYKNVNVIRSSSKLISIKRNEGVLAATSDYVFFIDSDAYPLKGWIDDALELLKTENVGVVGGPNLKYNKLGIDQDVQACVYKSFLVNHEPTLQSEIIEQEVISSSNMGIRKKTFINEGMFSEKLMTGEDVELCFRLVKKSYKNYFIPSMKVSHKQRNILGFLKQRFVWGRGIFRVYGLCRPYYKSSLLPFLLSVFMFVILYFSKELFFLFLLTYLVIVLVESARVCHSLKLYLKVYLYIVCSIPAIGLGSLYSIFFGDIQNYNSYNNSE